MSGPALDSYFMYCSFFPRSNWSVEVECQLLIDGKQNDWQKRGQTFKMYHFLGLHTIIRLYRGHCNKQRLNTACY